jgi:hypothetical protein
LAVLHEVQVKAAEAAYAGPAFGAMLPSLWVLSLPRFSFSKTASPDDSATGELWWFSEPHDELTTRTHDTSARSNKQQPPIQQTKKARPDCFLFFLLECFVQSCMS